jgi:hypothetical protein
MPLHENLLLTPAGFFFRRQAGAQVRKGPGKRIEKHKPFQNVVFECFTTNFKGDKRGFQTQSRASPMPFSALK